jgi:very-short-patch-repair endonuclease
MESVPGIDAGKLEWLEFEQSGVLSSAQALEVIGRDAARSRLHNGRWRRICRGVFSTHNGPLTRDQQLWAAVLAAGPGARLAGVTAATESGVRGLPAEPIQVIVPAQRMVSSRLSGVSPDMAAVRVYRTTVLPPHHEQTGRPPRVAVGRAVIDAAAWAPSDRAAQVVIASACQQRRVKPAELRDVLAMFPSIRRHRLIGTTIANVEGGAEALSEIDLLALCRQHGLPRPEMQQRRADATGRNRYIDAYWPEARLQVEVDGAHHMDTQTWVADMLRQNQIWIAGDRVLRFPAWLLHADPAAVALQIRAVLDAARSTT